MSNGMDDRIQKILAQKKAREAKRERAKKTALEQQNELQKQIAAGPVRWMEHWRIFQDTCSAINEKLSAGDLRIELSDVSKNKAPNDLAMFQVLLYENNNKSQHFLTCTVSDRGDLQITRQLPGLTDSKHIDQGKLSSASIEGFLVQFVENAQGLRTIQQMMTDLKVF